MSRVVKMLCLANSKREGARCIAGLELPDLSWIRPVGPEGSVERAACQHFAPLDVVRLRVSSAVPNPVQPENWLLADSPIERVGAATPQDAFRYIASVLTAAPSILGSRETTVEHRALAGRQIEASLTVVEPHRIEWARPYAGGYRARFEVAGVEYDMSVTDVRWRAVMDQLQIGERAGRTLGGVDADDRLALTVSLAAEPYPDKHYKFVAGVLVLKGMRTGAAWRAALGPRHRSTWATPSSPLGEYPLSPWEPTVRPRRPSPPVRPGGVTVGSRVRLAIDGEEGDYVLGEGREGWRGLSPEAPVGHAIIGRRPGEVLDVDVNGRIVQVRVIALQ